MPKPFRWSIGRREQLGSLASDAGFLPPHPAFLGELRDVAARVLALADGADLAFIGRTPENLFDYLGGVFEGVDGAPRLHLVQFSLRWPGPGEDEVANARYLVALGEYFDEEGVDPASIATRPRPLALVDMVQYGGTMHSVVRVLHGIAARRGVDWRAVQRRLRIIGLVSRTKTSPKTWRWHQHQDWLHLVPDVPIKNVSADEGFIATICGFQPKVTRSFGPARWVEEEVGAPEPTADQRRALAMAAFLYDLGRERSERLALAARLAATREMRRPSTRALVLALRRG